MLINPDDNPRNREFNLDHIFSIQQGFLHNIEAEIIGNYTNLRVISSIENRQKYIQCDKTIDELIENYKVGNIL